MQILYGYVFLRERRSDWLSAALTSLAEGVERYE